MAVRRKMSNRSSSLQKLLNMRLKSEEEIGDHLDKRVLKFARLATMSTVMDEQTEQEMLISSPAGFIKYDATVASVNNLSDDMPTWDHVSMISLGENKRGLKTEGAAFCFVNSNDTGVIATLAWRSQQNKLKQTEKKSINLICYN